MENMNRYINEYESYLVEHKKLSVNTLQSYRRDLRFLVSTLKVFILMIS